MTAQPRLLQLHGIVVDLIYQVGALPKSGEEAIVSGFQTAPGGGFNAMAAARRSGMPVSYGGKIGSGPFGDLVAQGLNAEGIDMPRPRTSGQDQGCCTVMIEPTGERTFVAAAGAEGEVKIQDLNDIRVAQYDWCLLSGYALYYENSCNAFLHWLSNEAPISNLVFDPSPIVASLGPDVLAAALSRALWVSANEIEAAVLTGESDPFQAARHLSRHRPENGGAVVRCGARGCIVAVKDKAILVPGYPVDAVDTNGAGDTHLGAFIAALSRGQTSENAAQYANVAAALSTKQHGPATAPDFDTIEQTLRSLDAEQFQTELT